MYEAGFLTWNEALPLVLITTEHFFNVSVERMFSTSGWLLNQRRTGMSGSTLDVIEFLEYYFERQKSTHKSHH